MIKTYKKHKIIKHSEQVGTQSSRMDFKWLWEIILERKILVFSVLFLLVTLPIFLLVMKYQSKVEATWYDTAWLYRKQLVFNNSAQASNLTNFPVLVTLDSNNFKFTEAQSAGQDIRFTDPDGSTLLPYEIESYDSVGLTARIWVNVPQIDASSSTDSIYMYWGNSGTSDAQSADNTWNSNYKGVYHLSDNAASTTVTDSSGNTNNITSSENTNNGFYQSSGKIGGSFLTAGTPTYITNQSGNNLQEIYPDIALDSNGYPVIVYFDNTNADLVLVHCNDKECKGGDESVSTVDSSGSTGYDPSIQLDNNGYPMIAYYYSSGADLKYVHCNDVNCTGGDETFTTIDSSGTVGRYPRMVLDGSFLPVIAYYYGTGADLKIVHCGNANCSSGNVINTVDSGGTVGNGFHGTDLILDGSGFPVMSYYDTTNTELKVAHCNDVNCSGNDEAINSPLSSLSKSLGSQTAIELDGTGLPMIAYYNTTDTQLEFIHCDDVNCAGDETVNRVTVSAAADSTTQPSMEKASSGNPIIVADRGGTYPSVYACANTNCSTNTATYLALYNQYNASYPNFKLDANNNLYVVAYTRGKTGDYDTYLVTTQHKLERSYDSDFDYGTGSFSISAWFKSTGLVQKNYLLSRYNADKGYKIGFNYAGRVCFEIDDDSSWGPDDSACSSDSQISTNVDNGNGGTVYWNSMVLDTSGFPVIAYFDNSGYNLELIHCNDANCTGNDESYASVESTNDVGRTPSIVLDSAGFPVIAYHDNTNGDLRIVHCGNANCTSGNTINTIDGADDVGDYPTVKLDSVLGYPVIAYFDTTNTAVKLVRCNDVNCSGGDENIVTLVNDEDDRVRHGSESLQLDGNNYPMVVYYDNTNGDLKYIHCNDVNCDGVGETKVNIDSGGTVGDFASMVLDSSGYPVIAYMDSSNIDLKLVHCGNSNCNSGNVINTVSSITGGDSGYYNINIKLNLLGNPVILYTQLSSWSSILTVCNDVNCSGNDETSSRIRGDTYYNYLYHSLAIDTSGYPVISFANNGSDLNLLHLNNTTTYTPIGSYDDNAWHHLAAVKNGTSSITTYVDGVSVGSDVTIAATGTLTSSTATLNLAEDLANGLALNNWTGYIDEVQIDNTARSANWVAAQYLSESNNFINAGITENGPTANSLGAYTGDSGALKNNLIGYWKFDEGHDATTNNSVIDGSLLNGTITGATWNNNGKYGKTLRFDGTTGDYITMPAITSLTTGLPFTISAWVNPESTGDYRTIVGYDGNHRLLINSSGRMLSQQDGNFYSLGNGDVPDGSWTHVIYLFNGTEERWYINGKQSGSSHATAVAEWNAAYKIGQYNLANYPYKGLIDEVKIYNSALTEDEIKLDYNRGSAMVLGTLSDTSGLSGGSIASSSASAAYCVPGGTTTCNPPVGEWKMDEKTSTNAYDTSGNENTCVLTNSPTWSIGKVGGSTQFGSGTNYLNCGNNSSLTVGTNDFTISTWLYPTAWITNKEYVYVMRAQDGSNDNGFDFELSTWGASADKYYLGAYRLQTTAPGYSYMGGSSFTIDKNTWSYVTVVRQGQTLTWYLNGVKYDTDTNAVTGTNFNTANNFSIAKDRWSAQYQGKIDQFQLYNYARTPTQIAWDYNQGKPIGWWKMDECQGGNANDSSGNSNTGTITIGATGSQTAIGTCTTSGTAWYNGVTGKYNSSLNFDGTDDYIYTADSPSLDMGIMTISAWIKTGTSTTQYISERNNATYYFATGVTSQKLCMYLNTVSNNWDCSTKSVTDGSWHHVVSTWDGTNKKLYIDGLLDGTFGGAGGNIANAAVGINIGVRITGGTPSGYFNGQIDDVRIFNYALTPQQVKTVYNSGASIQFAPAGSP
jgi:hypothetical protein